MLKDSLSSKQGTPKQTRDEMLIDKGASEPDKDELSWASSQTAASWPMSKSRAKFKPDPYNWEEIEHLFPDGKVPDELKDIDDPMQWNYLLVKFKKEFNERTHSEFIDYFYMKLHLPYISRRDECGGVITDEDWKNFIVWLAEVRNRVRRKRNRMCRWRKKQGKKLMPRKYLFKPPKKPNLKKNELWNEVFNGEETTT